MKRFWRVAAAVEIPEGGEVRLDGRPVKTPGKTPMRIPTLALTKAVAAEWAAQGEEVKPDTMPLTQLVATALDLTSVHRAAVVEQTAAYGGSDLLCYRAGHPADLDALEAAGWDPLLAWVRERYGVELVCSTSIIHRSQAPESLLAFQHALDQLGFWPLTGVQQITAATGSLVLALAVLEGHIDSASAFALSQIHETYQIERWGKDDEAAHRRERLAADIETCAQFLTLLKA